ncbi:MAG: class II aldolase/adducin family protein [Nostoc sp.]|uniref:class II aldolase/adducin family protein n=1 Tax=Nostoc sp. TaxID=1180 RepID=UPI002FF3669F
MVNYLKEHRFQYKQKCSANIIFAIAASFLGLIASGCSQQTAINAAANSDSSSKTLTTKTTEKKRDKKAVILRNHGFLTVEQTVDEAAFWYISFERSAQAQLLAEAAGKPLSIDHETATFTHNQVGTHSGGWFSFQLLYDRIVGEESDLLE